MIDLYFCSMEDIGIREQMAMVCLTRWLAEPGVRMHMLTPKIAECPPEAFQLRRRIYADEHADSSVYIVADDDCLPQLKPFAEEAARLLDYQTEFRILSLMPSNANIQMWTPGYGYVPYVDGKIMEHVSVGGIRFCRKPVLYGWPPLHGKSYDMAQAEAIRKASRRVGYFREFKMNHLGEGYSTVWGNNGKT